MSDVYVDHIGIIVKDLENTLKMFKRTFGLTPAEIKEIPDAGLRVAHLETANIRLELIEYTQQGGDIGKRSMGTKAGVNHFSVKVDDMEKAIKHFKDEGVNLQQGFPRGGSHGQVAFFDTVTTHEILFEICGD